MSRQPIEYLEPDPAAGLADVARGILLSLDAEPEPSEAPPVIIPWSDKLEHQVQGHRIAPLVHFATSSGAIATPQVPDDWFRTQTREAALLQLALTAEAQRAISALSAEGIETRVLKGLATGPLDYPRFATRQTGDVDLLVRQEQFAQACRVLADLPTENLKADEPAALLVESTFKTPSGIELDLHHRLFRITPAHSELLFQRSTPLPEKLGEALSAEGRLLHAAGHLLLSPPGHRRLSSLFDVALLDNRPDLDSDHLDALLRAFGLEDVVAFARWLVASLSGDETEPPKLRHSIVNRAHLRHDRSIAWETAAVLAGLGFNDRLTYLRYQGRRAFSSAQSIVNRRRSL